MKPKKIKKIQLKKSQTKNKKLEQGHEYLLNGNYQEAIKCYDEILNKDSLNQEALQYQFLAINRLLIKDLSYEKTKNILNSTDEIAEPETTELINKAKNNLKKMCLIDSEVGLFHLIDFTSCLCQEEKFHYVKYYFEIYSQWIINNEIEFSEGQKEKIRIFFLESIKILQINNNLEKEEMTIFFYTLLIQMFPKHPFLAKYYISRGSIYTEKEGTYFNLAIKDFEEAIKLIEDGQHANDYARAYALLAEAYQRSGRLEKALKVLNRIIASQDDYFLDKEKLLFMRARIFYDFSLTYHVLDDINEALEYIKNSNNKIKLSKSSLSEYYFDQGDAYKSLSMYTKAKESYNTALNLYKEALDLLLIRKNKNKNRWNKFYEEEEGLEIEQKKELIEEEINEISSFKDDDLFVINYRNGLKYDYEKKPLEAVKYFYEAFKVTNTSLLAIDDLGAFTLNMILKCLWYSADIQLQDITLEKNINVFREIPSHILNYIVDNQDQTFSGLFEAYLKKDYAFILNNIEKLDLKKWIVFSGNFLLSVVKFIYDIQLVNQFYSLILKIEEYGLKHITEIFSRSEPDLLSFMSRRKIKLYEHQIRFYSDQNQYVSSLIAINHLLSLSISNEDIEQCLSVTHEKCILFEKKVQYEINEHNKVVKTCHDALNFINKSLDAIQNYNHKNKEENNNNSNNNSFNNDERYIKFNNKKTFFYAVLVNIYHTRQDYPNLLIQSHSYFTLLDSITDQSLTILNIYWSSIKECIHTQENNLIKNGTAYIKQINKIFGMLSDTDKLTLNFNIDDIYFQWSRILFLRRNLNKAIKCLSKISHESHLNESLVLEKIRVYYEFIHDGLKDLYADNIIIKLIEVIDYLEKFFYKFREHYKEESFLVLAKAYQYLANHFYSKGNKIKALENYDYALKRIIEYRELETQTNSNSLYAEFLKSYATILMTYKEYIPAIEHFSQAITLLPCEDLFFLRGCAYFNQENYQLALNDFEKCLTSDSNVIDVYQKCSEACYNLGDYEKTINYCNSILELDPVNTEASDILACAENKLKTEVNNEQKAKLNNEIEGFFQEGLSYKLQGSDHEALRSLANVTQSNINLPCIPEAHYHMAMIYLKNQNRSEAQRSFNKVIELTSKYSALAFYHLANIAIEEKNKKLAKDRIQAAVELEPFLLNSFYQKIFKYKSEGRYDLVIMVLDIIQIYFCTHKNYQKLSGDIASELKHAYYHKGLSLKKTGHLQEAILFLSKAAEKNHHAAQYFLALCYIQKNIKLNEAFELLKESSKTGHVNSLYQLAICYLQGLGTQKNIEHGLELMMVLSNRRYYQAIYFLNCYNAAKKDKKLENQDIFLMTEIKAKRGDPNSQFILGSYFENGFACTTNFQQALFWYEKAADSKNFDAYYRLGMAYVLEDLDCERDLIKAARYFEKASQIAPSPSHEIFTYLSVLLASNCLKQLQSAKTKDPKSFLQQPNWNKAKSYLENVQRAEPNSPHAIYFMALCYYYEQELEKATQCFEIAAEQGYILAEVILAYLFPRENLNKKYQAQFTDSHMQNADMDSYTLLRIALYAHRNLRFLDRNSSDFIDCLHQVIKYYKKVIELSENPFHQFLRLCFGEPGPVENASLGLAEIYRQFKVSPSIEIKKCMEELQTYLREVKDKLPSELVDLLNVYLSPLPPKKVFSNHQMSNSLGMEYPVPAFSLPMPYFMPITVYFTYPSYPSPHYIQTYITNYFLNSGELNYKTISLQRESNFEDKKLFALNHSLMFRRNFSSNEQTMESSNQKILSSSMLQDRL